MLDEIRKKIQQRRYEFSKHAVDQSMVRNISVEEVEQAVGGGCEIIEDYPNDKYAPSCLILGFTKDGRPLHIQCSYPSRPVINLEDCYGKRFGKLLSNSEAKSIEQLFKEQQEKKAKRRSQKLLNNTDASSVISPWRQPTPGTATR